MSKTLFNESRLIVRLPCSTRGRPELPEAINHCHASSTVALALDILCFCQLGVYSEGIGSTFVAATTSSRQSSFCMQLPACCCCSALPGQLQVVQVSSVLLILSSRGF